MQLTQAHIDQYLSDGYTLVKNLIPAQQMVQLKKRILEVVQGDREGWPAARFHSVEASRYADAQGNGLSLGFQRPALQEKQFEDVVTHPNLVKAMGTILDGPVELFTDQTALKAGRIAEEQGGRSYFHQDSYYWRIAPELGCNCWIPTDTVGKDNIAIAVMPGSHAACELAAHEQYYDDPPYCGQDGTPFKRHRIPADQIDFSKEILVPMEPGDGLFSTNYTWHRSEPNRTGEDRAFYAIAYRRSDIKGDVPQ